MTYHVSVLTLFTEFFDSPLSTSIAGRATESGLLSVDCIDIRDFATDKHRKADDLPYGGGAGMVMKCEPVVGALEHARDAHPELPRIFLTPQGEPFRQSVAAELAAGPGMILLCGHYEGIDQRIRDGWIDREISIGDYVLTGGEAAAMVVIDAVSRLVPGVVGNPDSLTDESFADPSLVEYPHYTRPREFRGMEVPDVLLSGHHARIEEWRHKQARRRTQIRRPDLFEEE